MSPFPHASVLQQLDRILASRLFTRSARMRRFLRYTVELALAGKSADIKEYGIGTDVFDRKSPYDPRLDPIVRVEARRLRQKLCAYYESEGRDDALIVEFAKGSYVPLFRGRETAAPVAETRSRTIAVLPFTNLSPGAGHEYFSDGLTEELIHALTRLDGLRVVAWNSAAQLRDREQDIRAVGEQLGVETVLTGSVRIAGNQLRVRAQLVETSTGFYLWSESYDRLMSEIFTIQEEIARAIVRTLRVQLSHRYDDAPIARAGSDIDSYELYLKGRYHWNQRTREGLTRAVQFFTGAIALDEHSALAYAGLADGFSLLADYGLRHPTEAMPKARMAAQRALELDPGLAEAWTSLALIRSLYDWEWREAETCYKRAVELNPGYVTTYHWLAVDFYAVLGRFAEAQAALDIARQLDPLSLMLREGQGFLYILQRQYQRAIDYSAAMTQAEPGFYKFWTSLGRALTQVGAYDRALEALERGRELGGDIPNILAALGQAHALAGRPAAARDRLAQLRELAGQCYVPSTCLALLHIALGEKDRALDALEAACEKREMPVVALNVHPNYDSLRAEPRFHALLLRMGLARGRTASGSSVPTGTL